MQTNSMVTFLDEATRPSKVIVADHLGNIEENWALFNVEEKQKVLRLFVKSVTVFPGRGLDRVHIEWIE